MKRKFIAVLIILSLLFSLSIINYCIENQDGGDYYHTLATMETLPFFNNSLGSTSFIMSISSYWNDIIGKQKIDYQLLGEAFYTEYDNNSSSPNQSYWDPLPPNMINFDLTGVNFPEYVDNKSNTYSWTDSKGSHEFTYIQANTRASIRLWNGVENSSSLEIGSFTISETSSEDTLDINHNLYIETIVFHEIASDYYNGICDEVNVCRKITKIRVRLLITQLVKNFIGWKKITTTEYLQLDENGNELNVSLSPIHTSEAKEMANRLAREEGIFAGTSSGSNVAAAIQLGKRLGPEKNIVTLMIDSGLKYLI